MPLVIGILLIMAVTFVPLPLLAVIGLIVFYYYAIHEPSNNG